MIAALLTKYKPADAEKPVIRPYTPISDEGMPAPIKQVMLLLPLLR